MPSLTESGKKTIWNFSEKNTQIALIVQKTHWDYVKKVQMIKPFQCTEQQ